MATVINDVRAGRRSGTIAVVGDSNQAGHGAGSGARGLKDARSFAPPRLCADFLCAYGIPAQEVGVFGAAGTGSEYYNYDRRVVMEDGWSAGSSGPGGGYFQNSSTKHPLLFNSDIPFDTLTIWHTQDVTNGDFQLDWGCPAEALTFSTRGDRAMIKQTISLPIEIHNIRIQRCDQTGIVGILGWTTQERHKAKFDIWNLGICGARIATANLETHPWSPRRAVTAMKPDIVILDLGTNDMVNTSLDEFKLQNAQVIEAHRQTSDIILCTPIARKADLVPEELQVKYADAIREIASDEGLPLLDIRRYFGDYQFAAKNRLYFDATHLNRRGHALKGRLIAHALQSISQIME
ncbi:SGNH/GDSL hydrolase family protein [Roseomonas chloroacetimidivorans]|uniref:SGNH/GDSL hydrolase family protein n=1 Tax=Roseomonas chloroacetimidivorans TaxID=1766656 RepID=UPI003C743908